MKIFKKETTVLAIALFALTTTYAQRGGNDNEERPSGPPSTDEIFKKLDANEDDKISLKEAEGPLKKDFSKIDADEDGFITKEELEKAPKPKGRPQRDN